MGDASHVKSLLRRWPDVEVRSGHTVVEYEQDAASKSAQRAKEIFGAMTTEYRFTALDTSTPDVPTIMKGPASFRPDVQTEVTLLPQLVGG